MLQVETEKISGLTRKLKDYMNDLEAAFAVLDTQEKQRLTKNNAEKLALERELFSHRIKVENQALIKNQKLSEFIKDIDSTLQDIQLDMLKRSDENCFSAYMIDFAWKMIQVKLALIVRQLNWNVATDFMKKDQEAKEELQKQKLCFEIEIAQLNKHLEAQKAKNED